MCITPSNSTISLTGGTSYGSLKIETSSFKTKLHKTPRLEIRRWIVITLLFSAGIAVLFHQNWINVNPPVSLKIHQIFHRPSNRVKIIPSKKFSALDPVSAMDLFPYNRSDWSSPSRTFGKLRYQAYPLPTNSWYENMLTIPDTQEEPHRNNHVYSLPYLVGKLMIYVYALFICITRTNIEHS